MKDALWLTAFFYFLGGLLLHNGEWPTGFLALTGSVLCALVAIGSALTEVLGRMAKALNLDLDAEVFA